MWRHLEYTQDSHICKFMSKNNTLKILFFFAYSDVNTKQAHYMYKDVIRTVYLTLTYTNIPGIMKIDRIHRIRSGRAEATAVGPVKGGMRSCRKRVTL